jgi:hypothetical protein
MKDFINYMADPIRSFPIFLVLFYLMLRYVKVVATKKFAWIGLGISLPIVGYFMADYNFRKIVLWPDNVPIAILIGTVVFFTWFSLYKGVRNDGRIAAGEVPIEALPENREKVWCWPNLVYTELFTIIAGTMFLIVWAIYFKAPLEEPANPTWAPNPAKAPWYFLGLQEMLVYFDPWYAGVIMPGLIVVGLLAIPYIDTNPKGNGYYCYEERKFAINSFLFGWLALWVYLIIVGTFLRGPNWTFYGPFEYWDYKKVVAEYNVNLSEFFWIKGLNRPLPSNMVVREFLGIMLTIGYFVFLPLASLKSKLGQKLFNDMGTIRYFILIFLFTAMASLPIKMALRWMFSMKYIIALPELELNF